MNRKSRLYEIRKRENETKHHSTQFQTNPIRKSVRKWEGGVRGSGGRRKRKRGSQGFTNRVICLSL